MSKDCQNNCKDDPEVICEGGFCRVKNRAKGDKLLERKGKPKPYFPPAEGVKLDKSLFKTTDTKRAE